MKKQIKILKTAADLRVLIFLLMEMIICAPSAFSQYPGIGKKILDDYNQSREQYFREKLYVHTDKETYLPREICWFRIYYMDAFYHAPASFSKIAYVEILDRNNRPVLQQKISLVPGEAGGSMIIPLNVPTGVYKFRAYTSWMKNFGPDGFFEKAIRIINPHNPVPDSTIIPSDHYDVQFFPEGGNLIQDIESKVAFRVVDAYGKGQEFEGTVIGSTGDTLVRFHPLHMGLGHFMFTAAAGKSYRTLLRFPNGKTVIKDLPVSYPDGYVLRILTDSSGRLQVEIFGSSEYEGQDIFLMIHGSHSVLPVKTARLVQHRASFSIGLGDLEEGISQVTLFNRNGEPMCERLVFKYPEHKLEISAEAGRDYGTRNKISLSLNTTDQSGRPADADLSMSVYRLDSLENISECDIRYDVYLSSDLGFVESPSFYFQDGGKGRGEDMENLLLTHGWRRFSRDNDTRQKSFSLMFAPEYNGHIIQGTIVNNKSGNPVPAIDGYLSVPSLRTQYRSTISNNRGRVKFEMPGFYGSQELIVQTNPREDSTAHIEIDNPFSLKFTSFPLPYFRAPAKNSVTLLDLSIHEQVQRVYDGAGMNRFDISLVDTNPFYVVPDEKYLLDDYTRFQSMEEVFREYVHSLNVVRRKDRFQLFLFDNPNKKFFEDEPLILVDGIPFFYTNELFRMDPLKIRRIDLVNRQYSLGIKTYSGIVNVTTYHGDLNGIELGPHLTVLDYPGIPEQRQFFSPEYETEKQISSRMPDYRTLLYWAPQIKTGAKGASQLVFYSSDLPGRYVVEIQGLTGAGVPGSQIQYFNVRK